MRSSYVVGNWKMNQNKAEIFDFIQGLKGLAPFNCESWIAPQSLHINLLKDYTSMHGIKVGAQNCSEQLKGAFTGEISPAALSDLGADFVILGHSERRTLYGETNQLINQKIQSALSQNLVVIFCVGESLEQREAGETFKVLSQQLQEGLKGLEPSEDLLIAYEPVWAIGTGKTASPEQANEAHAHLRQELENIWAGFADKTAILYGGSVKPANFQELLACEHIDGGLVGGASLNAADYASLCQIASKKA
jgi:triosephosphate isomerase